jgi:hypothetical protein
MRKHSLLSLSALASLTLAASMATPASAAARASQPGHAASAVEVGGTVTSSGKDAPGVKVTIHAWPSQKVDQAVKIGQKVPWVLVGSAMTDASGKYSISIPVSQLMPESSNGVVNLEADSSAGSVIFPVVVTKDAGNSFLTHDPVANISGAPGPGTFKCHGDWFYQKSMGKHYDTVGQTYVPGNVAKQQFSYSTSQSSALGVGWSFNGDGDTFSEVGIMGESSSFGESWPTFGPDRSVFYRTEFHYGEYKCIVPGGIVTGHLQAVNGYAGGAEIKTPPGVPPTPSRFCVGQMGGSSPHSNNTTAVTWRKSLGLQSELGFDATSETGYDTGARLTYSYLHSGRLCGWADYPGGDPRQLVAREH